MNKVIINMNDFKVADLNVTPLPFQFEILIDSIDDISKENIKYDKVQKKNEFGEKIFKITRDGISHEVVDSDLDKNDIGKPVFELIEKKEYIKLNEQPYCFSLNDILISKQNQLINKSKFNNCHLYEVDLQSYIDMKYVNHKADIGYKLIRLHQNGSVKLKPIIFNDEVSSFDLNIETKDGNVEILYSLDDNTYKVLNSNHLERETKKIFIILNNKNNFPININSYHILF